MADGSPLEVSGLMGVVSGVAMGVPIGVVKGVVDVKGVETAEPEVGNSFDDDDGGGGGGGCVKG